MAEVFVDSSYWIARLNPRDGLYYHALRASEVLADSQFVTTDSVLIELLNMYSGKGPILRIAAMQLAKRILNEQWVRVIPQKREHFYKAMNLYGNRSDKAYSLTDCMSMIIMNEYHIKQVLTSDRHFEQEGFEMLMKSTGS